MMPRFRYTITTVEGQLKTDELEMPTEMDVRQYFEQQGSVVIRIRMITKDQAILFRLLSLFGLSVKSSLPSGLRFDCVRLTEDWVALLSSGLTLVDSIQTLIEWQQERSSLVSQKLTRALQQVLEEINAGKPLDQAWLSAGLHLNPSWVLSIKLGMQTAQLAQVLGHWLMLQSWRRSFRGRLKKLLTYPMIAFSILLLVLGFMLVWVLPDLMAFLVDMNAPVNQATRSMLAISHLLVHQPIVLFISVLSLIGLLILGIRLVGLQRIPYFGTVSLALDRAYLMRELNWLLSAGATLHDAVGQMLENASTVARKKQLQSLYDQLAQGVPMPKAVVSNLSLPPFSQKLLKLAEKTGQLAPVTQQLADYFEAQAKQQLDRIEPWVEPMTTLLLGALVVWMILAILGPIYEMMADAVF